jgi:hypothetical protein
MKQKPKLYRLPSTKLSYQGSNVHQDKPSKKKSHPTVSDVNLMIKWSHNHNKFENQPKKVEYQV